MKLMQVMAGGDVGGAEEFFARLCAGVARTDIDQLCVTRPNARNQVIRDAGGKVAELPFGSPYLDLKTRFGLSGLVSEFKPDIALAWMNRASTCLKKRGFVKLGRLGGYYKLKNYADCDHLIGNTRDIVDYLVKEGWPADRAHYVPNFVWSERAEPVDRSALGTPDGVPVILCLGRLHENKAFDVMIRALADVPDAVLWLAGEGKLRESLGALADDLGVAARVRFLGWRRDVSNLFAAADILCCPSRHEPLGNVVIEGWAQARPVVAARSEGPSVLIQDGASGLLADKEDAAGLASALNRVIKQPGLADQLVAGGTAAYEAEFTEQVVVARYRALFNEVTA